MIWQTLGRSLGQAALASAALLSACSETKNPTADGGVEAGSLSTITIPFVAKVGAASVGCGQALQIGDQSFQIKDLRFYTHAFQLLNAQNQWVDAQLLSVPNQQNSAVALLDFEDGTGACEQGTSGLNSKVRVLAPQGSYSKVRFVVGVPFDANHKDPSTAGSPLDVLAMHWGWMSGYKFFRFDVVENASSGTPRSAIFHLGSTGCQGDIISGITGCNNANRATVELDWSPNQAIEINLQELFPHGPFLASHGDAGTHDAGVSDAGSHGGGGHGGTPGGRNCMSEPANAECMMPFAAIGLSSTPQTLFRSIAAQQ